jgi:hypothetical protein
VKRIHVAQRENPIVNRLNKTKVEKFPDLAMEKENRLKELRKRDRLAQQARVSYWIPSLPLIQFAPLLYPALSSVSFDLSLLPSAALP